MKRLFAFVLTIMTAAVLAACSMPAASETTRSNSLSSAFTANAHITLGKLTAEGEIQRFGDGMWAIEFSSPNTLSGVKLSFSEGETTASYKGLEFSVPQSALPVRAMTLNLIAAVDSNARLEELRGEENGDALDIRGTLDGGDYVLSVDKEGHLCGFSMPNNELTMTFTELTVTDSSFRSGEEAPEAAPGSTDVSGTE